MGMLGMHDGVDTGPGLTKQANRDEVDINKIIAGFEKTGMVTHLATKEPFYGDVSDIKDYQESLDIVNRANELFMGMDARIRERFKNDPEEMITFLEDPKNLSEAISLGMVVQRPEVPLPDPIEPPVDVPPVTEGSVRVQSVKRSDAKFNKGGSMTIKDVKSSDAHFI